MDLQQKLKKTQQKVDILEKMIEEKTRDLYKIHTELLDKNKYLDNILENMIDLLVELNPDAIIKTVNKSMLSILGYNKNELIGKPFKIFFTKNVLKEAEIEDLIKKGIAQKTEMTYLSKDGKETPVLLSTSFIRDDNDNIQGIVCIGTDITKIKQIERELRKKISDLEDFTRIAVQRELKMKRMEEEMDRLNEEIKIYR
ncbi:MAG: PAS domain-containing protein [Bacteroidia bacterium]|nr:PAS domain-containing protein [Bacteroidia bacterium]